MTSNPFISTVEYIAAIREVEGPTEVSVHQADQLNAAAAHSSRLLDRRRVRLLEALPDKDFASSDLVVATDRQVAIVIACLAAPGVVGCPHYDGSSPQPFLLDMSKRAVMCNPCEQYLPALPTRVGEDDCDFCGLVASSNWFTPYLFRVGHLTVAGNACDVCKVIIKEIFNL